MSRWRRSFQPPSTPWSSWYSCFHHHVRGSRGPRGYWLSTRTTIRPGTLLIYTGHVELHLIPHLGRLRLGELNRAHLTAMFAALATASTSTGRRLAPGTPHRIRATLRAALNTARLRPAPARQPGLARSAARSAPPTRPGVDRPARHSVARARRAVPGRGVDPSPVHLPELRRRRPAVHPVAVDRPSRSAPGRGRRAALGRPSTSTPPP